MDKQSRKLMDWKHLDKEEQTRLLVEYGYYQDDMAPSCDINIKQARFTRWLDERGIRYE
jgi:hypothetical protein